MNKFGSALTVTKLSLNADQLIFVCQRQFSAAIGRAKQRLVISSAGDHLSGVLV